MEVIYGTPETPKELLPMATVHMMTTSHSLFLPIMLATQDDSDSLHMSKGNEVKNSNIKSSRSFFSGTSEHMTQSFFFFFVSDQHKTIQHEYMDIKKAQLHLFRSAMGNLFYLCSNSMF